MMENILHIFEELTDSQLNLLHGNMNRKQWQNWTEI